MKPLHFLIHTMLQPTFLSFILLFCAALSAQVDSVGGIRKKIIIIPVSGNVDPALAAFIGRALRDYPSDDSTLFILEMDTFGGRVDAALKIVDTLSSLPKGSTVAFVKNRAISAGALIALACSKLVMRHNTTIGDCAPITVSNEGPKMLGEKFQSPLRARFRALAKRNNYPPLLAESMVTAEMIVIKITMPDTVLYLDSAGLADLPPDRKKRIVSRETIVRRGELLTMDNHEAQELGFSCASVNTIEELLAIFNSNDYNIIRVQQNWSEKLVSFIAVIAPILMMIGFAALYTEMKSPGFGIPGIVGIVCLALVFGGQYIVGLADYTEILLLAVGMILLAAEVFVIPGFGIAGILGILFLAAGMMLSFQDFVIPEPNIPWQKELLKRNLQTVALSLAGSIILIILFFKYIFPRLSTVITGPSLTENLASAHIDSDGKPPVSVGDRGVVVKPLRPSGSIQVGQEIYDAIAEGEFLEKGTPVVVSKIRGNTITVLRSEDNSE